MTKHEFISTIAAREFNPSETIQVLTYGYNKIKFWSWGVSKRINYSNKALMLQVNGRYHKGKVYITLAWDDTYTVYITTNRHRVIKKLENVYFDALTGVIDREIESR